MKMCRKAFTLVELLVVLTVIAILLSMLLPALARARRYSYRVVCAANLSTWGDVAVAYATDHQGLFPTAYGYGQGNSRQAQSSAPIVFPMALNLDSNDQTKEFNGSQWKTYGTPYSTFLQYGGTGQSAYTAPDGTPLASASEGISIPFISGFDPTQLAIDGTKPISASSLNLAAWMVCPDSPFTSDLFAATEPGNWGYFTLTSYMYVGGTPARATSGAPYTNGSGFNDGDTLSWGWRENKPGVRADGSPQDVLAADTVGWSGSNNGNAYFINHPNPMNPQVPDFQNVLYADGHVQGVSNPGYYDPNVNQAGNVLNANNWAVSELTPRSTSDYSNSIGTNQSANWMFYWPNLPVGGIGSGNTQNSGGNSGTDGGPWVGPGGNGAGGGCGGNNGNQGGCSGGNNNQGQNQGGCSGGNNNQGQNQGGWSGGNNNQGQNQGGCSGGNNNQGQNQGGCSGGNNNQGQNQGGCSGGNNNQGQNH